MADIEQTRAVVEAGETYDGKLIPSEQASIDRPVRIHENATVEGSVYGTDIELESDATVQGSVLAKESIELIGGHVCGEAGTPGKVVCEDARIDCTLTGKKVRLEGCVVRGNVVGTDVIIEDSVVLGLVAADRDLILEDSLCYTFRVNDDMTADGAITVLPQGIVEGDLQFDTPIRVAGLGKLETDDDSRLPEMGAEDIHSDDDDTYLTLAPRILNLAKVEDRLEELEEGVMEIVNDTADENSSMAVEDLLESLDIDSERLAEDIEAIK